jgi:hypothetical protein
VVRLAVYHMPGDFDCRTDTGVAQALEALLLYVPHVPPVSPVSPVSPMPHVPHVCSELLTHLSTL